MRILRSSFYVAVLPVIASTFFAMRVGAAPVPRAAMPSNVSQTTGQAQAAPRSRPAKHHHITPAQDGDQLLTASNADPEFFPKQLASTSSAPQTIVITNTSATVAVNVTSLTFAPATNPGFSETDNCVTSLAPGATCNINLSFTPAAANVCLQTPTLTLNDDDPGGSLVISAFGEASALGGLVTEDLTGTTLTPTALAQSLVGSGVSISNVTYTGAPIAAGTFTNGANIIGFDTGVILSDGAVPNVIGPNCDQAISQENGQPGDQDLTNLICTDAASCSDPTTTNDAAILEFDFVPTNSLLTFQYVFASDEYPEFVFDFNDVFAFFLNQTGTPKKDIALIPGTNTIVSINNVNDGNDGSVTESLAAIPPVNPQFFVNNNLQFPTVAPLNTEMDGLTTVLAVQSPVIPGQTYHIKLAIADAIDEALDSNVFIKGGSLSSTNLSLSPPALGFGNVNVEATSSSQSVIVTNMGSTPLTSVVVGVIGPFAQTNNCPGTLAPAPATNSSCVVNVTFDPTTAGPANGSITFTDSAPDSPQAITLGGTAISGPFVVFSPTSLTFPPGTPGTVSAPQTITVTNSGVAALTIASIISTVDSFAEADNCVDGVTIEPKGTCTITVTYDPAQAGTPENGLLVLSDNAQTNGTQSVSLTGNITTGITIAPLSVAFGNQAVNTASAPQTVTFTNTGSANVTIPSVVVGVGFTETNNCTVGAGIAPAASCTAMVTFTPGTATSFSTNLTFTDSAPNSPQVVALTGTGTAAGGTIAVGPLSLTFASQAVGTTSPSQNVIVSNTGTTTVTFTAIATSGDFAGATLNQCPTVVAGASCTFPITFTPTATGARTGAVTFTDNATGSPQTVPLTGTATGSGSTVTIAPTSLTFAQQALGTTSPVQTVTVTNTGTPIVNFTNFTASGDFAVVNSGSCSTDGGIPAGGSCTVAVTFTPTAAGTRSGALMIADSAIGSPQTVTLTGGGGSSSVIISVPSGGSTTATTTPGGTAFYGLIISGAPGVTGAVQLTCASSSPLITCTVIPSTVTLNGGTTEVAFGIQTFCQGSTTAIGSVPGGFGGGIAMLLAALLLGGIGWTFQRDRRAALTFATLMLIALGAGSCASLPKSANGVTPAGTYFISLSTTLNGQTQTLPNFLTLVVK